MSRTRRSAPPILLTVVATLAAGCSGSGNAPATTVKVALEGPITGPQSSTGVDMLRGVMLAVDEANADGGVLGRKVQLIRADDRADPDRGRQVAEAVVNEGAFAVVGPYNSSVGVENLPIYLKAGVIPIHLTSTESTDGEGYTVQPKDYQVAPVEANAIVGLYKAKRVAIVYDPSTYTAGIARQVRSALDKAGVTVVSFERVNPSSHPHLDLVKRIANLNPDLVYASTYYPEGAVLARKIRQLHLGGTCFMGLANQDPAFVTKAGLSASRDCVFSGVPSAELLPGARQYVRQYRSRFGADPGTWGSFTYDSMRLLFDAVRRAGGWTPGKVRQALSETENYTGITGSITIDPKTGNRKNVPVVLLDVNGEGHYVIDPKWEAFSLLPPFVVGSRTGRGAKRDRPIELTEQPTGRSRLTLPRPI
jgi:branched-chain amino acid transport system substrate-binding protein